MAGRGEWKVESCPSLDCAVWEALLPSNWRTRVRFHQALGLRHIPAASRYRGEKSSKGMDSTSSVPSYPIRNNTRCTRYPFWRVNTTYHVSLSPLSHFPQSSKPTNKHLFQLNLCEDPQAYEYIWSRRKQ